MSDLALTAVMTAGDAVAEFASMPADRPALCCCCPRPLMKGAYSVAVAIGAADDPKQGLALGIWPDVRRVHITHARGGSA